MMATTMQIKPETSDSSLGKFFEVWMLRFMSGAASFGRDISRPLPRSLTLGSATSAVSLLDTPDMLRGVSNELMDASVITESYI